MITISQIRAGRAMINWTQRELANAAGISLRNLHNIESGLVAPRLETIRSIKQALEKSNIEFEHNNTVRLREEPFELEKYEGIGVHEFLFRDPVEAYRGGVKEFLLCNTNERSWRENVPAEVVDDYFRATERYKVKERCLTMHGDKYFLNNPTAYRWLPHEYFSEVPYAVYGNTLVLIVWRPTARIAVIRNAAIAESFRRHFELAWEHAEPPPYATFARQHVNLDKPRIWLSEKEITRLEQAEG